MKRNPKINMASSLGQSSSLMSDNAFDTLLATSRKVVTGGWGQEEKVGEERMRRLKPEQMKVFSEFLQRNKSNLTSPQFGRSMRDEIGVVTIEKSDLTMKNLVSEHSIMP